MSSPARSTVSTASAGGQGNTSFCDDTSACHLAADLISALDRKDEALAALKSELMASLQKEVKSLDEDSWKFSRPRSQIHLISRPGGHLQRQSSRHGEVNHLSKQTRNV